MIFQDLSKLKIYINKTCLNSMGIDYGVKKTGIAISKNSSMALPACVIKTNNITTLLEKIQLLIKQYETEIFVLGFPSAEYQNAIYLEFATHLVKKFNLPIYLQDETYSSRLANQMLEEVGLRRKKRNAIDDQIAAKIILDTFLDRFE